MKHLEFFFYQDYSSVISFEQKYPDVIKKKLEDIKTNSTPSSITIPYSAPLLRLVEGETHDTLGYFFNTGNV